MMFESISDSFVYAWADQFGWWIVYLALAVLAFELIRYAWQKKLSTRLIGDTVTNFATYGFFIGLNVILYASLYVVSFYYVFQFAIFDIEVNWATTIICLLLADLAYYWEHRFTHRVSLAWASHTVHHSSSNMNMSVAIRFGPMDSLWPIPFHLPLVLLGFNPLIVFACEAVIQYYQTLLHTETVKKLPRPFEFILNTPSHHRVHHGANPEYIDRNYGGFTVLWDRLFGTFAEEKAPVKYGLVTPETSINPFVVFFTGIRRLVVRIIGEPGWGRKVALLFEPPRPIAKTQTESTVPPSERSVA